ncbi:MAG: shikimate dehydrogenase [Deltaproteobacteria bacterium]|nr:shikimate dehydrogenase [Deltaproteobacteria bacterium]
MNRNTMRFALFGNPVGHSLSPLMHGAAFREMGLDASYRAIRVENAREIPEEMKKRDITGASITIPHKTAIMPYLDTISDSAELIGAINTVTREDHRLRGDNTDWTGLIHALKEKSDIGGKRVAVLGAGGAARAAVYGILHEGGIPVVVNRTVDTGQQLAREFECDFLPLAEIGTITADCLINTTPVGMFPETKESPVDKEILPHFGCIMDIVYNPLETRLLKDAAAAGCRIISGVAMFVHQGAEQLRIWMGLEPPTELMEQVVLEKLRNETN